MLLVGYEGHDNNVTGGPIIEGGIGIYAVVPEPGSSTPLLAGASLLLARRRKG